MIVQAVSRLLRQLVRRSLIVGVTQIQSDSDTVGACQIPDILDVIADLIPSFFSGSCAYDFLMGVDTIIPLRSAMICVVSSVKFR